MARGNFDAAFEHVIGSEGGLSLDRNDRGNWTTGEIGKGELKGTKHGISAMAYPSLDIKNLSLSDAKRIYKRDYWDRAKGDDLPPGLDLVVFDAAVNSGLSRSAKWLQQALDVKIDGLIGPDTLTAAKAANPTKVIDQALANRLEFLQDLPTWARYGNGWRARVNRVKKTAREMSVAVKPPTAQDAAWERLVAAFREYERLRRGS
jgi:lysozyme family protein